MNQAELAPHEEAAREARDLGVTDEWSKAAERGRRLAAENIRVNPAQRKLVEEVYGVAYCHNRYPEAYQK